MIVLDYPFVKVKHENGSLWLLVFHHNSEKAGYFKNLQEATYSKIPEKFSILSDIDKIHRTNDKYEFLIEYPINNPNGSIRSSTQNCCR